ncbi:Alpha/beta hydrolase [Rhodovastum atsumiense]|uniref:Alpha/beta hydrolase n=1 Tax=Rhodovastum atsumiense TaxID=504468 RepID=A0A5M6IMG5_9PROT|nr:alpha/beta hydrolase [Rhodovastum atsumiense]KAA5609039.1 alpha/beta hydrolase [Rhodovastum atsumiense]CAH2604678.1 Alpha/beta hydrolase [Rhodovastum atsumiense]
MLRASATATFLLACLLFGRPALAADRYFVTSDGVRLHYTEVGQGRTIVMVPGWTMPAWIFDRQIRAFSRFYRVVAFDPRSQGESEVASSGHDPWRRGQDIAELLEQLGPEPVLLMGWSLGVLDSLAYINGHGDRRVAGLVLIDNSVGEDPPPSGSGSAAPRRRGAPPTRAERMRAFVDGMFTRPLPKSYLERLVEACLRTPPAAAAALLSYPVPRTFWKEALYSTSHPVLYVVRPTWAGQAANVAQRHPNAETVIMQGVGHALFVDDPDRFDRVVTDFIRRRVWP